MDFCTFSLISLPSISASRALVFFRYICYKMTCGSACCTRPYRFLLETQSNPYTPPADSTSSSASKPLTPKFLWPIIDVLSFIRLWNAACSNRDLAYMQTKTWTIHRSRLIKNSPRHMHNFTACWHHHTTTEAPHHRTNKNKRSCFKTSRLSKFHTWPIPLKVSENANDDMM